MRDGCRATDERRLRRQGLLPTDPEEASGDEAAEQPAGVGRKSIRRSFGKILGPILDYAGEFELLQFVHDLALWTDVGSKRCGRAPYEWSAPYHRALLGHMAELLRSRQHLPGPESLHLAHVMTELLREWVVGGARKFGDERSALWRQSQLQAGAPEGERVKLNFAARLEFQDGKRRQASQAYHGRGAVHLHALIFAEACSCTRSSWRRRLPKAIRCGATCLTS